MAKSQNVNLILDAGGNTKVFRNFKPRFFGEW